MAHTVRRKIVGRTITKDQLDSITEAVMRKFPAPARRYFSIHRGSESHTKDSLESVVRAAGSPTIVRKFSIVAKSDERYFHIKTGRDVIDVKVWGEDYYFTTGFLKEIACILDPQPNLARRAFTRHVHLALRCALVLGGLASVAPLLTPGDLDWNGVITCSTLVFLNLFFLVFMERRASSYVLLENGVKEQWKRTEKIALVGVAATLLVGLVTNGVNLAIKSSQSPVAPKSPVSASPYVRERKMSDRTPGPSRSTTRAFLASIHMTWDRLPADGFAILTGEGFTPGEDVKLTFSNNSEPAIRRVNSKGEIGPTRVYVGSSRNGRVEVVVMGEESGVIATFRCAGR
ncbi:hypothetical protein [Streptomyces acidiscabies]|uniref:hypothetical protein n=1 Tax=Streptomyces acidiscabies TaxID=42234 RepID=UPI0038F68A7D